MKKVPLICYSTFFSGSSPSIEPSRMPMVTDNNIYINDLANLIKDSQGIMVFADNTSLLYSQATTICY